MAAKSEVAAMISTGQVSAPLPSRTQINVVLFSGGSGTHSITEALRRHPQISLTILINAYDDGHSTGRLRRFLPGMLGPSDVRKNISRLMPSAERGQKCLQQASDYRLPVGMTRDAALALIDRIIAGNFTALPEKLANLKSRKLRWRIWMAEMWRFDLRRSRSTRSCIATWRWTGSSFRREEISSNGSRCRGYFRSR